MNKKAWLILADGTVFEGNAFGASGKAIGEAVFTTVMTGYQETLTNPNYFGQLVVQTFPSIGNYGVNDEDNNSEHCASGYIVREYCEQPSNFRSNGTIDGFLKKRGIVGICSIDTRSLTRILRDKGSMNAGITDHEPDSAFIEDIKAFSVGNPLPKVSVKEPVHCESLLGGKYNIALIDYGVRLSTIELLHKYNCDVTVLPYNTKAEDIIGKKYNGVVLSDGPGDPADFLKNPELLDTVKKLFEAKIPLLGIGLGHLVTALALGGKTAKLKSGHRGANQPVVDLELDRTFLTLQSHGYVVETPPETAKITHVNANDRTCEGISYGGAPVLTLQFEPQTLGSKNDTSHLAEKFIKLIKIMD
ncbi:MAG: carbamoyl phosphate synthase small subunit [Oscillospiraceae bacterium]|nr:carbamoyl phosphate synthase small subunit [Oscillospiraceae bacterium]